MRTGYIAVRGADKAQVLERLGEVEGDRPARLFSDPCVGVSKDGWVLVMTPDPEFPTPERLATVSAGAEAVGYSGCTVVMCSGAFGYRDGRQVWSVEHNGQEDDEERGTGAEHLEWSGDLPPRFDTIVAEGRKTQAEEEDQVDHLFDVPADVAAEVCGLHHERAFDFELTALQRKAAPPKAAGLLGRLFGRR